MAYEQKLNLYYLHIISYSAISEHLINNMFSFRLTSQIEMIRTNLTNIHHQIHDIY